MWEAKYKNGSRLWILVSRLGRKTKRHGTEKEYWTEDDRERTAGESHGWAVLISSPRLVLSLSSSRDQGNNQPESRASCPHDPEPSLLGLRLEFLPGCPELPGRATAHGSSLQPCLQSLQWSLAEPKAGAHCHGPLRQLLRAGLASWSGKVPGHVTL